jgi:putative acetyltransferase
MNLSLFDSSQSTDVIELYTNVFSNSEGEEEGRVIGDLVSNLISTTEPQDLIGFVAGSNINLTGCIFFSRIVFPDDDATFILSPVAITTSEQGKGYGQQLINYGLSHLKSLGVNLVFTYGDPNFYCKVGFTPISEAIVRAPFELSQPEGWLAQSLDGSPIKPIQGTPQCVPALNIKEYW